jgi:DNA-binding beta-propeller fold protein YncE
MRSPLLALIVLSLGACVAPGTPPDTETTPETTPPVLLVSQKAAKTIAWYTLEGELLAEIPVSDHPHEIVRSPDGSRLFVTDNGVMQIENAGEGGNRISVIDLSSRARTGEIDLGRWHRPHGIDVCADGTLLVTAENPDQLLVLDPDESAIVKEYDTGGETPHIVRCSPDSKTAYVSNARSRTVAKIDVASGERSLLETGDRPEGSTLSIDGSTLFVVHRNANKIAIIDTAAWKVRGEIPTGDQPVRCGLTTDEKTLTYALLGDQALGFADVETRKEIGKVQLAGGPVSLEMHEDGETALSCAQDADTCYVVSVPERRILHTVQVREGAAPDPALLLEGT